MARAWAGSTRPSACSPTQRTVRPRVRLAWALAFAAVAFVGQPPAAQGQTFGANDAPFLNLVGDLEGPAGFGDVYDRVPFLPPAALDAMTIGQVLHYQRDILEDGTVSSAVARYQFLHDTLVALVDRLDLHEDLVFDGEVQTYLARHLMARCGFYDPNVDVGPLGDCLAGIWAALPVLTGPSMGRSAYEGIAGNKALVTPETVRQVLADRFSW